MDVAKLKAQSAENWGKGDYSGLSEQLRPAARVLADACAVSAGQEVLDNAAGDGNFAVICAEEGASVVAADIAPNMVAVGRERSEAEGVDIEWLEADAEELPFEDARFDCVGSVFGAMLRSPPARGRRGDVPRGQAGRHRRDDGLDRPGPAVRDVPDRAQVRARPAAEEEAPPSLEEWSREDVVRERFEGLAGSIEVSRATLPWEGESPEGFIASMERHAPMQVAAMEAMPPDLYAQLREEMVQVAREWAGGDGPFSVEGEYAVIVARRPG